MTTADIVRERAMALARSGADLEEAVAELERISAGSRVAVVRARQQLLSWLDSEPDQTLAMTAIGFLDQVAERLTV